VKVLLVDDEKDLISTLAERLSLRDIDVSWATSGDEALDIAQKEAIDIAVLDLIMPGMDGLELKKRLEKIQPNIKFTFLTGHGSEENFKEGAAITGKDFYLIKPVPFDTLLERLKSLS